MTIALVDTNNSLADAWLKEFDSYENVKIIRGSIFDQKSDAIISPANSFGIMDGGIDGKLRDFFGQQIEDKVREKIADQFHGEMPVGYAVSVKTGHKRFKYLISAPTMRVPEDVSTSLNAYLAMRAILMEADKLPIKSLTIPGLASLSGRMPLNIVARQMRVAYDKIIMGRIGYSHWREEKALQDYLHCKTDFLPEDLSRKFY